MWHYMPDGVAFQHDNILGMPIGSQIGMIARGNSNESSSLTLSAGNDLKIWAHNSFNLSMNFLATEMRAPMGPPHQFQLGPAAWGLSGARLRVAASAWTCIDDLEVEVSPSLAQPAPNTCIGTMPSLTRDSVHPAVAIVSASDSTVVDSAAVRTTSCPPPHQQQPRPPLLPPPPSVQLLPPLRLCLSPPLLLLPPALLSCASYAGVPERCDSPIFCGAPHAQAQALPSYLVHYTGAHPPRCASVSGFLRRPAQGPVAVAAPALVHARMSDAVNATGITVPASTMPAIICHSHRECPTPAASLGDECCAPVSLVLVPACGLGSDGGSSRCAAPKRGGSSTGGSSGSPKRRSGNDGNRVSSEKDGDALARAAHDLHALRGGSSGSSSGSSSGAAPAGGGKRNAVDPPYVPQQQLRQQRSDQQRRHSVPQQEAQRQCAAAAAAAAAAALKRRGQGISVEQLRMCFHLPITEAALRLKICVTALKKTCRQHGIRRWPHRQILAREKAIEKLQEASSRPDLSVAERTQFDIQLQGMRNNLVAIIQGPMTLPCIDF